LQYFEEVNKIIDLGQQVHAESVSWKVRLRRALVNFGNVWINQHLQQRSMYQDDCEQKAKRVLTEQVQAIMADEDATNPSQWERYIQSNKVSGTSLIDTVCL